MDIWLCCWCWYMAGLTSQSSMLRVNHSVSTFHHQSLYDAKDLSFSAVEAAVHSWQDAVWCLSASTQCPCFQIIPKLFKHFKTIVWSTPNDSASSVCTWHESSWSNAPNTSSSNFFGAPECSLSSTTKSLFFKCLNQSLCVVSDRVWLP